jgi:hypothetical protein
MPRSKPHLLEQNDEWTVRRARYMTLGHLEKWVLLIPSRKNADNDFGHLADGGLDAFVQVSASEGPISMCRELRAARRR